jgi:hypothetical protein
VVLMAGRPAMTMREIRLGFRDKDRGEHWSRGECWCGADHRGETTALPLVPPPWDLVRMSESADGAR